MEIYNLILIFIDLLNKRQNPCKGSKTSSHRDLNWFPFKQRIFTSCRKKLIASLKILSHAFHLNHFSIQLLNNLMTNANLFTRIFSCSFCEKYERMSFKMFLKGSDFRNYFNSYNALFSGCNSISVSVSHECVLSICLMAFNGFFNLIWETVGGDEYKFEISNVFYFKI